MIIMVIKLMILVVIMPVLVVIMPVIKFGDDHGVGDILAMMIRVMLIVLVVSGHGDGDCGDHQSC